jgi:hypothetical protein
MHYFSERQNMNTHDRGFAPTIVDAEYEQLWMWWVHTYQISHTCAQWLALYQYTGGNAFGLVDVDGRYHYAPRGEA